MTTPNEIKPAAPAEAPDGGRCAVADGSASLRVWYAFTVKGRTKGGCKITLHGNLKDEPGYPQSAFDGALAAVRKELGDDLAPTDTKVSIRQLKKRPLR